MSIWISNSASDNVISRCSLVIKDRAGYASAINKLSEVDLDFVNRENKGGEVELLKLFDKKTVREEWEFEYYCAKNIIDSFKTACLDGHIVKEILEKMWPNFTIFAIDVLASVSIVSERDLDISKVRYTGEFCKDIYGVIPSEIEGLLSLQQCANSNSKVLSLAKKTRKMCCPSDNG